MVNPSARVALKRRQKDEYMRLGLMWPNSPAQTVTSRAVADRNPDILDIRNHVELAQVAEELGLDFAFLADSYASHSEESHRVGHQDPGIYAPVWAGPIITATEHLGVITTLHTTYFHPAVIARLGANLDQMSRGRWGWNIVTGYKEKEMKLFGQEGLIEHDLRYQMAEEVLNAVKMIWDSGMDDIVEYRGREFQICGSMKGPRPLQKPYPLLVNAGSSVAGQNFAVKHCDYIFTASGRFEDVGKLSQQLEQQCGARQERDLPVLPLIAVLLVMGDEEGDAERKYEWLQEHLDWKAARAYATNAMGGMETFQHAFKDQDERSVLLSFGIGSGSPVIKGTAKQIAEQLLSIYHNWGVRGFIFALPFWSAKETRRLQGILSVLEQEKAWIHPRQRQWSW